jgi:hypothetical protein
MIVLTIRGFMITDGGAVVITGLVYMARIDGSCMVPVGPDASPAITGTDNKRRRTSVPIRRPESAFMYSPEGQGTAGIPGYMPFTSHRFKRIDVYFMVLKPSKKSGNGLPVFILPRQGL